MSAVGTAAGQDAPHKAAEARSLPAKPQAEPASDPDTGADADAQGEPATHPSLAHLSTPWWQWRRQFPGDGQPIELDAVVIGSGYGGAVAALRLAERGFAVTVLERGGEYRPGDFPNDLASAPKHFRMPSADGRSLLGRSTGLYELRAGPGLVAMVGNGLGGGSLVNAGVLMRPDEDVFAQDAWPAALRLDQGGLDTAFARAHDGLQAHSAEPMAGLPKARALDRLGRALQPPRESRAVEFTIDPALCTRCGDCASGCNEPGAKITLRDSYLRAAVVAGAELVTEASVYRLGRRPGGGWTLRVLPADAPARFRNLREAALPESAPAEADRGAGVELRARRVVIAAGSFGSTELLQRSQALEGQALWLSPALGSRLSANGDSLSFSANEPQTVGAMGIGADAWQREGAGRPRQVGPTITRLLDLRQRPAAAGAKAGGPAAGRGTHRVGHEDAAPPTARHDPLREAVAPPPDRPDFEHRLLIQEGAVPAALGRLYAEMLATAHAGAQLARWTWNPPRGDDVEPLSAGHWLGGDPARNAASLPQRTQVLLTMGHDRSAGRIVWVDGRDASVPWWERPEELETYRHQERVLSATCGSMGASWTPNPAWRLLPPQATAVMSGPRPSALITTVHPLGGCPMSDSPRDGVVDHLGRVWASDDGAGEVYEGLWVLDGAIVPTSLGCNPMLTITALAERAMAQVPHARPTVAARPRAVVARSEAVPPAQPLTRTAQPVLPAQVEERLGCAALTPLGALAEAFGDQVLSADLSLQLLAPDWNRMWDDPDHPFEVRGLLRLEPRPPEGRPAVGPVVCYRVTGAPNRAHPSGAAAGAGAAAATADSASGQARLLVAGWQPPPWRWVAALPARLRPLLRALEIAARILALSVAHRFHLPRAVLTWWALRGDDLFRKGPEKRPRAWLEVPALIKGAVQTLLHTCEVRRMHYSLSLQLEPLAPAADTEFAAASLPLPPGREREAARVTPEGLPPLLWLEGDKRVDYAATWGELWRWWRSRGDPRRPPLRASFLDQLSHLHVRLSEGPGGPPVAAPAVFALDFKDVVDKLPLRPVAGGDLPGVMAALAAYPLVFGRFALKTRLFDFRLPDYSGRAWPDASPESETTLRTKFGPVPAENRALSVRLGSSSSDLPEVDPLRRLRLRLWRYRRPAGEGGLPAVQEHSRWQGQPVRKARSVLLVHAFAQSGYSFTLKSTPQNLAEALYDAGYEVWILEHRISTRLPAHREQSTMDQIAWHDVPTAVRFIQRTLERELPPEPPDQPRRPLQIMAFAQCLGAASTAISLLAGRLSHGQGCETAGAEGLPRQRLPLLAGLVISQTHPHCVGAPLTQAKSWVPALLRDALRLDRVPFAVRGPQQGALQAFADRLFAALPVPPDEACPARGPGIHDEDDCATCRRIRFIEAPLFRHANLAPATHRELPLLFGDANVRLFAHAAKCVEAERLVTEDGDYGYVTDARMHRHLALPVCFLHGGDNELFDAESARRSARQYARVHPRWADRSRDPGSPQAPGEPAEERAAWVVPGYGHLDVLIGQRAHVDVFPGLVARFDHWWRLDAPAEPAEPWGPCAGARVPRTGPLIGAVRRDPHTGRLRVGVSFRIDDRFSDGKDGPDGAPGSRTWAFARVRLGDGAAPSRHTLAIEPVRPPVYPPRRPTSGQRIPALRMAHGELDIDDRLAAPDAALEIECFSVHESLVVPPAPAAADLLPLHPSLAQAPAQHAPRAASPGDGQHPVSAAAPASPAAQGGQNAPAGQNAHAGQNVPAGPIAHAGPVAHAGADAADEPPLDAWLDALLQRRATWLAALAREDRPARQTVSYFRLRPERFDSRLARLSAAALDALAPRAAPAAHVAFAIGTCRYPGFRFDRHRVDRWIDAAADRPADVGLLLGDQIYADATAGFADELSPSERFFERHRIAFVRGRDPLQPGLGDWLAKHAVVMTPDDHEFHDGYPDGAPLVKTAPQWQRVAQAALAGAARSAVRAHQALQSAPLGGGLPGVRTFTAGPARVLVLDTRSRRRPRREPAVPHTLLGRVQWRALQAWLDEPAARERLNVIATGSVLLPALHERGEPPSPGAADGWQSCPPDRERVLALLAAAGRRHGDGLRVLLVSGDYHVSTAVALDLDGRPFGACLVAPPLYSPMPFLDAAPHLLRLDEPLPDGLALRRLEGAAVWRGNGLGHLSVAHLAAPQTAPERTLAPAPAPAPGAAPTPEHRFALRYSARLQLPDQYESGPREVALDFRL